MKLYLIGTKVYMVQKDYVDQKKQNGKVLVCKVKTYENQKGKIVTICSVVGQSRFIVNTFGYYLYDKLDLAISAINSDNVEFEEV